MFVIVKANWRIRSVYAIACYATREQAVERMRRIQKSFHDEGQQAMMEERAVFDREGPSCDDEHKFLHVITEDCCFFLSDEFDCNAVSAPATE